jgi:hypothetical protein
MEKDYLILKRATASRPSSEWSDDDFDVLANGEVVGPIFKANAAPVGSPWMWAFIFPHQENGARRPMAMPIAARLPWAPLPRAGGGSKWTGRAPKSSFSHHLWGFARPRPSRTRGGVLVSGKRLEFGGHYAALLTRPLLRATPHATSRSADSSGDNLSCPAGCSGAA